MFEIENNHGSQRDENKEGEQEHRIAHTNPRPSLRRENEKRVDDTEKRKNLYHKPVSGGDIGKYHSVEERRVEGNEITTDTRVIDENKEIDEKTNAEKMNQAREQRDPINEAEWAQGKHKGRISKTGNLCEMRRIRKRADEMSKGADNHKRVN